MDPVRTCIGCRSRANKAGLIRVAINGSELVIDHRGCMPGRGVWLHPTASCIETALERRQFRRAFRSGAVNEHAVHEYLKQVKVKVVDRTMDQS